MEFSSPKFSQLSKKNLSYNSGNVTSQGQKMKKPL